MAFALLALCVPGAAAAQDGDVTIVQIENVRIDYARVLRVEPVYQTLRATRMEHNCDPPQKEKGLSRVLGTVKDALTPGKSEKQAQADQDCRLVPIEREFKRPIAYDVDYVYKGSKYRSRLPRDPGSRLRIRVSVTPYLVNAPGAAER
ncbi:hypothetical protein FCE95_01465 [Luteimonas gilva]|uniref:DUF3857 domain-containing protein n=1 Tax=Luteimonas gilva TaxID=2572684 RepID=A0A4U5JT79_9GAMM|nr:hypothetical protein [Luteimonas gilva]TKR33014.1 hypothetical protein FCE95_01465 [Luteimonas gilva]